MWLFYFTHMIHVECTSQGCVSFREVHRKKDGEWELRWIWEVFSEPKHIAVITSDYEGFDNIDDCIADYNNKAKKWQ